MSATNAVLMDHQHGAINNRCIHPECQAAFARWSKKYRLDKHRGVDRTLDCDLARKHIAALEGAGWSRRSIAGASGISPAAISRMMHGQKTIKREVLEKLLAVDPTSSLPDRPAKGSQFVFVPRIGTTRRIQALLALGWTHQHIGDQSGVNTRVLLTQQGRWVARPTHDAIAKAYRVMAGRPGPSVITRRRAAALGYLTPAAWNDVDMDAEPDVGDVVEISSKRKHEIDEVVVERVLGGERHPLTLAERLEVVRRARAAGWSYLDIETRTGINKVERYLQRLNTQEAS